MRPADRSSCRLWSLQLVAGGLGLMLCLALPPIVQRAWAKRAIPEVRFTFNIDPKTPHKDLLPLPPKQRAAATPVVTDDLSQVPEIFVQEPLLGEPGRKHFEKLSDDEKTALFSRIMSGQHKTMERTAHGIAKIKQLNQGQDDHFIRVLLAHRTDLQGLPFVLGAGCRMKEVERREFASAAFSVRACFGKDADAFWREFPIACRRQDEDEKGMARPKPESLGPRIAALTQILGGEPAAFQPRLVPYLAEQRHREASRALARLAIFSEDASVGQSALAALGKVDHKEYTEVIVEGLGYPWPAVARRAASAVAALKRLDLAAHLVDMLERPDPRAPTLGDINGKSTPVAREVVRINHHRSCVLCHPPWTEGTRELTGAVPIPDLPLTTLSGGYRGFSPDLLVRADVTFLRPDFSLLQKVPDADPWPERQRFDFLVRTRALRGAEATRLQEELAKAGQPYREAALAALRRLTGADAGSTPKAWRELLTKQGRD
jgi:hypothetical protein